MKLYNTLSMFFLVKSYEVGHCDSASSEFLCEVSLALACRRHGAQWGAGLAQAEAYTATHLANKRTATRGL